MTSPPTAARWRAPHAAGAVHATVSLPGSKSVTSRALLLAALADGPSVVRRPLRARDTDLMVLALRALGTSVRHVDEGWSVRPAPLHGPAEVDCGLAGTVMRFVPPVATLATGTVRFDGDPRARERPMGPIVTALRDLGATIDDDGRGALPFELHGRGSLPGGAVTVDASASSQFVSALLLAAARFDEGADLRAEGTAAGVPSRPHIDMTVRMLRERGVTVDSDGPPGDAGATERWRVHPGPVKPLDVDVEPDLSNAAPFLAAALATGGAVTVRHWPATTDQPGDRLRTLLTLMGGRVEHDTAGLAVTGPGRLHGVDVDLREVGELTPVLAALCALAETPSRLRGIAHLRGHETDRLAAIAAEINALGGDVRETDDGLRINPRPLHAGLVHTYADHRMAHAAAVLGLVVPGVELDDVAATSKTYPEFPGAWESLLT